jgi:hypothetical protein
MSLAAFLERIVAVLRVADVPFMLTGSLAAAFYGQPRGTQDMDVVVELDSLKLERLIRGLSDTGLYVSPENAREALTHHSQFNAIDPQSGWKVDLIIRKDRAFSKSEFGRRMPAEFLGVEVALTSVEDLIIAKLEWSELGDSDLQRRDVLEIVQASSGRLDLAYLEHWVNELGLQQAWQRVRAALG